VSVQFTDSAIVAGGGHGKVAITYHCPQVYRYVRPATVYTYWSPPSMLSIALLCRTRFAQPK
jgi:hypothetical protein